MIVLALERTVHVNRVYVANNARYSEAMCSGSATAAGRRARPARVPRLGPGACRPWRPAAWRGNYGDICNETLVILSSILGDRSKSRQLADHMVARIKQADPSASITLRDIGAEPIPYFDGATAGALFTPAEARSLEQQRIVELSDTLVAELMAADRIVFAVPVQLQFAGAVQKLPGLPGPCWRHVPLYAGRRAEGWSKVSRCLC